MQNVEFWSTAIQFKNWVFQTESWALLKTLLSVRHVFPADCCTIFLFSLPVNLMQTLLKQEIQNLVRLCFLKLHELFLDLIMYHFGSLNILLLKFLRFFVKFAVFLLKTALYPNPESTLSLPLFQSLLLLSLSETHVTVTSLLCWGVEKLIVKLCLRHAYYYLCVDDQCAYKPTVTTTRALMV